MSKEILFTERWNSYLKYFPESNRDIYFTEEYARLYEDAENSPECFVYKEQENIFLLIYIKRRVGLLEADYFDFETPYGYGGPLANTDNRVFISKAAESFYSRARENKIIAGFIRFHPLLNNQFLLGKGCQVDYDRKTVAMNLSLSHEDIWNKQMHTKHRNSIRKAQKLKLVYHVDDNLDYLDEFTDIYKATIERLKADEFYLFDNKYFSRMRDLKENIFLGLVFYEDKLISAALFFKYGMFGHYHLSGSLEGERHNSPNNFLIYSTALYLKEKGFKLFHLGGGNDPADDNSLYKFKRRFSKYEYPFYIGKIILNEDAYKKACSIWEEHYPQKKDKCRRFLKFRY